MSDNKVLAVPSVSGDGASKEGADYDVGAIEPLSSHQGELRRTFKARHIQMITLGRCPRISTPLL